MSHSQSISEMQSTSTPTDLATYVIPLLTYAKIKIQNYEDTLSTNN